MLPLERAQLFLRNSPIHVRRQFADNSELRIGMTWQCFTTRLASAWTVAFKKKRMMLDIGLDVEKEEPIVDVIVPVLGDPASADSPTPPVAPSFKADVDDVTIELSCKEEGCGVPFPYSQNKIDWLRDKFKDNFKMPSRCPTHKIVADANREKAAADSTGLPPAVVDNPTPKAQNNRFGTRRVSPVQP